jgi:anionic cell wall polymer biosynthesis LytR-Cps2A-Psr (LCP) family protein
VTKNKTSFLVLFCLIVLITSVTGGCQASPVQPSVTPSITVTSSPGFTKTPTLALIFPQTNTPMLAETFSPLGDNHATPIQLPKGVQVLLLAGLDESAPYSGRTDAVMLIFYDTRKALAAAVSLPPDLVVTIPNIGSGRLNSAYLNR